MASFSALFGLAPRGNGGKAAEFSVRGGLDLDCAHHASVFVL